MAYDLDPPLPRTATPTDYTRFQFDTAQVPDKRIVGLLACQRDPLLRSLKTKVHAARESTAKAPPPAKGKDKKKKSAPVPAAANGDGTSGGPSSDGDKGKLWEVELLDTVVFPEGGGQPSDTGDLYLLNPNGDIEFSLKIEGCLRKKLDSVHLVRVPPELAGKIEWEDKDARVDVDWERRMDHMTIHTSQHLLSAILDTLSLPTLSWAMHAYPSLEPPYVELQRSLSVQEAEEVEKRCNDLIFQGRKVWVDVSIQGSGSETPRREQDGGEEGGTTEERESRGLPKDYDGGVIRHINIQDTDRNACCGTQLPDISLLSLIHVIPPSTTSSTATKLYFTSGPRATRYLIESSRALSATAKTLGRARGEVAKFVEQGEVVKKDTADSLKSIRNELAKILAEKAVLDSSAAQGGNGVGLAWIKREEKSTHDFDFLGSVASTYLQSLSASKETEHGAENGKKGETKRVILLTSAVPNSSGSGSQNQGQAQAPTPAQTLLMIVSSDQELAKDVNERIKKVLGSRVKGGGARGRYMSKVDGKWGKAENALVQGVVDELRGES